MSPLDLICRLSIFSSPLVAGYILYRLIRYRRLSSLAAVTASLVFLPLCVMLAIGTAQDDIELNPHIASAQQLFGTYSDDIHSITLSSDGTYVAAGVPPFTTGTWSHHDWNLTLSNASAENPRLVTCNGFLCIAPYYRDVDSPVGLLLKKLGNERSR